MHVAKLMGTAVDFYSLEMSDDQVAARILADERGCAIGPGTSNWSAGA